jgi:hypothetical protein
MVVLEMIRCTAVIAARIPCTATEEMIPGSGIEGRMREQIRCDRFFLVR